MKTDFKRLPFLLFSLAGTGAAQTFWGGVSDPYCDHARCRIHGYPYEEQCSVHVIDYPAQKKTELLESEKRPLSNNPLQNRLTRRMDIIAATNFVSTNTIPINMAPGLTPEN